MRLEKYLARNRGKLSKKRAVIITMHIEALKKKVADQLEGKPMPPEQGQGK